MSSSSVVVVVVVVVVVAAVVVVAVGGRNQITSEVVSFPRFSLDCMFRVICRRLVCVGLEG